MRPLNQDKFEETNINGMWFYSLIELSDMKLKLLKFKTIITNELKIHFNSHEHFRNTQIDIPLNVQTKKLLKEIQL
jgi:hypothetical protein